MQTSCQAEGLGGSDQSRGGLNRGPGIERRPSAAQFFYDFDQPSHVHAIHLLPEIDRFLDLGAGEAAAVLRGTRGQTCFAHATNYLIDTKCSVIMDVEATWAIGQAEMRASLAMIDWTEVAY